jgi:DNA-binding beta-propeller fold protein YncE
VSVIDGRRCNGGDSSGCGQTPPTVAIGGFTGRGIAIDVRTNTVYATSINDSDVLVINGAACRADVSAVLPERSGAAQLGAPLVFALRGSGRRVTGPVALTRFSESD